MKMRKRRKALINQIHKAKAWDWHVNKVYYALLRGSQRLSKALQEAYSRSLFNMNKAAEANGEEL